MGTKVTAGTRVNALHRWPEANGRRSYLAHHHMHDFSIRVEANVTHDNRQIEFHDLRDALERAVGLILSLNTTPLGGASSFGSMSCEQVGIEILRLLDQVDVVRVNEDEFCGAVVTRETIAQHQRWTEEPMSPSPMIYLVPHDVNSSGPFVASKIITICGSTRFKKETEQVARDLSADGWIVLMVEFFGHAEGITYGKDIKTRLDMLHHDKIRHSDAVYIVNVGGYVGESTKMELDLARFLGKAIISSEPLDV